MPTNPPSSFGPVQPIDRATHHRAWYVPRLVYYPGAVSPSLVKWACGPFVDEGDGRAKRHAVLFDEPSAGHKRDRLMTCVHGLGGPCYEGARTASEDRATVGKKAGRYTQGGASLCPGLSHHAPLGRRKRKTRRQSLSTAL
jgi:hypothetical protein